MVAGCGAGSQYLREDVLLFGLVFPLFEEWGGGFFQGRWIERKTAFYKRVFEKVRV
jgi:hypothetical protein